MTLQNIRLFASKHRRSLVITSAGLVVFLCVGLYVLWSAHVWAEQKVSYQSWQKQLQTSLDTALKLPAVNPEERSKKQATLKGMMHTIVLAKSSLCTITNLVRWQHFIADLKLQEEVCMQLTKNANTFASKLQVVTNYLDNEQALTNIMSPLTAPDKVIETDFSAQVTKWQSAADAIKKLSITGEFSPVKGVASDKAQAIIAAWQEIVVAHTAQDKTKYTAAQAKLAQTYDDLNAIASADTQQIVILAAVLQSAYTALSHST